MYKIYHEKTKKYYTDYLTFAVKYCQDKGLNYTTKMEPESSGGYDYSILVEKVGLYHHFWLKFHTQQ